MNIKGLLIIIVVLVALNISALYLFKGQNSSLNPFPSGQITVPVPLNPDHKGVTNFALHYEFTGQIYDIQKVGDNTRFILNIADSQNPDFVATNQTGVIRDMPQGVEPLKLSDVTKRSTVTMFMEYNVKQKVWSLTTILVKILAP